MAKIDWDKVARAIETIEEGVCKRIDVDANTKVYSCGKIIRIDLAPGSEKEKEGK